MVVVLDVMFIGSGTIFADLSGLGNTQDGRHGGIVVVPAINCDS